MVLITNMSHARKNGAGRIRKFRTRIGDRNIHPGARIQLPGTEVPLSVKPQRYDPETNPYGMFDVEIIPDITSNQDSGDDGGENAEVETTEDQDGTTEAAEPSDTSDAAEAVSEDNQPAGDGSTEAKDAPDAAKSTDINADDAIDVIETLQTVEEVQAYIEGDTRKTVNRAADDRIEDLQEG